MYEDENIETAANVDENNQPTSPVEEKVDQTKAFAARLKEEKLKAKDEAKDEIAKSFGYTSWQEYVDAQTNNKLLDKGLDPETVRPVLKDLLANDPEYVEAMKFKKEKEELEKELFASNSLKALNEKFGTTYNSINELDAETINDWNKGTPLEKAFASNNYSTLIDLAVKKTVSAQENGKSHLKTVTGSTQKTTMKDATPEELRIAKSFGFSEEQYKNYINRTNKN